MENIDLFKESLELLLKAESIKYSAWNPDDNHSELATEAGIYHFYQKNNGKVESLYLGKAGFGSNDNWSLFQRLKQHFQISQKHTLLKKYAEHHDIKVEDSKQYLEQSETYLQWLAIFKKDNKNKVEAILDGYSGSEFESQIIWVECFCKSIMQPKYTDA
jgi:hypothetical protein